MFSHRTKQSKIVYVVYLENLRHPILESQVVEVLSEVTSQCKQEIILLWLRRFDRFFRYRDEDLGTKKELANEQIRLVRVPILAMKNPSSLIWTPITLLQIMMAMFWVRLRFGAKLFHCRSYYAGLAGALFRKITGVYTIFDTRSPYPEENVAAHTWKRGSLTYRIWKRAESWTVGNSSITITTTQALARELGLRQAKIRVIPNNVSAFAIERRLDLERTKEESNCRQIKICYIGSFGHWNNVKTYLDFLRLLPHEHYSALFITPDEYIKNLFDSLKSSSPEMNISVCSSPHKSVHHLISDSDVGLQLMRHHDQRLSIKVVEYLAAGVPVIVSENVVGAAEMIDFLGVGFVLKSDYGNIDKAMEFMEQVKLNRYDWRIRCQSVANEIFSTKVVARQYCDVYAEAVS